MKKLLITLLTILSPITAFANPTPALTDNNAILAIIGEAENQGFDGMLAVACAIRNRGTLKGVYGINAPRVKHNKYTTAVYLDAKKAWFKSKELIELEQAYVNEKEVFKHGKFHIVNHHWRVDGYDASGGASNWENINQFGKPIWANDCIETVRIKDHVFFKCE